LAYNTSHFEEGDIIDVEQKSAYDLIWRAVIKMAPSFFVAVLAISKRLNIFGERGINNVTSIFNLKILLILLFLLCENAS